MFGKFFTMYARKTYQNAIFMKENVSNDAETFVVNFEFIAQKILYCRKIHSMEASEDC